MGKIKDQKVFEDELYRINLNIKVLGTYTGNHKSIRCRCKIDNYEWNPRPSDLLRGKGCPVCANKKVMIGVNDMWTTNPELAKLLADPEDGYKYTQQSNQFVNWKCPSCGNIINHKRICTTYREGLSCPNCSDGISYPEKFMYNLLQQLNIDFIYQYSPKWCNYEFKGKNKTGRYDFYIPSKNIIVEMDGGLGHGHDILIHNQSIDESIYIDNIKDKLAEKYNIEVIRIDCVYEKQYKLSRFRFIKNSILNSYISKIFNVSNINWEKIDKNSQKSIVIEIANYKKLHQNTRTTEIAKIFHLNRVTICKYLKIGNQHNWCYYNVNDEIKKNYQNTGEISKKVCSRKVICLNNNRIFNSIKQAESIFNVTNIWGCCNNLYKFSGKLPDGTKLKWMYYDEYLKLNRSTICELADKM